MDFEEAVIATIESCIADGVLSDFLASHRAEVVDVFMTEFDAEKFRELDREDARAEGLAEGLAEGRAKGLAEGLAEGRAILSEKLRELGVDQSLIDKALAETEGHDEALRQPTTASYDS